MKTQSFLQCQLTHDDLHPSWCYRSDYTATDESGNVYIIERFPNDYENAVLIDKNGVRFYV